MLIQFLVNGLIEGCGFAIVALGLGLIYKVTKVLHIAHGALFVLAAYLFHLFAQSLGLPVILGIIIAIVITAVLGTFVEISVYYPLYKRRASPGVFIVASLGIYIALINIIAMIFSNETKTISLWQEHIFHFADIMVSKTQLIQLLIFLVVFVLFVLGRRKTRIGKIIQAVSDNAELSSVIGIDIRKVRIMVFVIGTALAAIGSCLFALDRAFDPHVGMNILFVCAAAVIIGGIDIFEGAIIGAISIGVIQNLVLLQTSARWEEALTFVLLIIFLLIRPQGILGKKKRAEEL